MSSPVAYALSIASAAALAGALVVPSPATFPPRQPSAGWTIWGGPGRPFEAIDVVEAQAWVVTRDRKLLRIADGQAQVVATDAGAFDPAEVGFTGLDITNAQDGWVTTAEGSLLHWDGRGLSLAYRPEGELPTFSLHDVAVANGRGWAVGGDQHSEQPATILAWNGSTWSTAVRMGHTQLLAVDMRANEAWAVGLTRQWQGRLLAAAEGVILHWDGFNWSAQLAPGAARRPLFDVRIRLADDVWAVGDRAVLRWNGNEWNEAPLPPGSSDPWRSVAMLSAERGWIANGRRTLAWDGTGFLAAPGAVQPAARALATDGVQTWACGDSVYVLDQAAGQASAWRLEFPLESLVAIDMLGPDTGVVGGTRADPGGGVAGGLIRQLQSSEWRQQPVPLGALYDVHVSAPDDAWAAGEGGLAHWDGRSWRAQELPATRLRSIDMLDAERGWAVGESGSTYQYAHGAWQRVPSPTTVELGHIDMVSETEGWAAAGRGQPPTLLHYDGRRWSTVPARDISLDALHMQAGDSGWAVGADSAGRRVALHYDGREWSEVPSPAFSIKAIAARSTHDIWFLTEQGHLLRYTSGWPSPRRLALRPSLENGQWSIVASPERLQMAGMDPVELDPDTTSFWAVGWGGTIARYDHDRTRIVSEVTPQPTRSRPCEGCLAYLPLVQRAGRLVFYLPAVLTRAD
jgi:hypothetical protein